MTASGQPAYTVDSIRDCLESGWPSWISTCAANGLPNVTPISQVHYVDGDHVALSYQFFNKTRENILVNPFAAVLVVDPATGAVYRLAAQYLRTDTQGPIFESMRAKLAGLAQHVGMAGVFHLLGSDVYRVDRIELSPSGRLDAPAVQRNPLSRTRVSVAALADCGDLASALDRLMEDLSELFGIDHAMVLMLDEGGEKLYTVASRGYDISGVGSEIPVGQGVIGVAARERTPIRLTHMAPEYAYGRAVRDSMNALGIASALETAIPLPGLAHPASQLAVPVLAGHRLSGVIFVESPQDLRFGHQEEDALSILATQLGTMMNALHAAPPVQEASPPSSVARDEVAGPPVTVRHYAADHSVFFDQDYVIKGVAGAILWAVISDHETAGRTEFSNRELRLDRRIRLPEFSENLEARLVLLERRLAERCSFLKIEKTGRGRFRVAIGRPLKLLEITS